MIRRVIFAAALAMALGGAAYAVEPSERLADPALEARARALSQELRCLVLLRKLLLAGDTDQQVLDYIVARYGQFVLLDPPFEPATYLLWLTPPVLVLGAGMFLAVRARRRRPDHRLPPLTEEEGARAASLLGERG
jgi:cytochrome c-type biogenesis protein CcmH